MSVVPVDAGFYSHLVQLSQQARAASDGSRALTQRRWCIPPLSDWGGNLHDLVGMSSAFSRDSLNSLYEYALLNPQAGGTVGDCAASKTQIDWIATMERAFRTRHASRIRCAAHASARRLGHGNVNGIFTGGIFGYVQGMVQAAADDDGAYSGLDVIGNVGDDGLIGKLG
jgi:hypothetical protein